MAPPGSPAPFTGLVTMLDMGRGRLKETVEALRVEDAGLLQGLGALHVAANRGRLEVCRYLVEELQVDVNAVDKGGRTPLFFAISCKGVGIAKYLLDHGANPNKSCHDGLSPLHEATASGDCETVKLLLAKGAYIDPVAFCGTPLHCAATQGHDGILKILLDHNADSSLSCADAHFYVPSKIPRSDQILRNKEVNGKTPLIAAVDADSRNCMLLLIRAGADTKGALTYAAENLHSQKLVSTDFVNCIKEDAAANRVLPDDETKIPSRFDTGMAQLKLKPGLVGLTIAHNFLPREQKKQGMPCIGKKRKIMQFSFWRKGKCSLPPGFASMMMQPKSYYTVSYKPKTAQTNKKYSDRRQLKSLSTK
uniref:Uncharacterized protein n=1 Tax=Aegilops tauschii TaxID=37682 RepID=M8BE86_AEGTA